MGVEATPGRPDDVGQVADWQTISSLATAGGTLVIAAATFSALRSSNRSARVAEGVVYLAMSLRNVGRAWPFFTTGAPAPE